MIPMTRRHFAILAAPLVLALAGCTHLGTHIGGHFSCRKGAADCQPVSVIDARTTRELLKTEGATAPDTTPRLAASPGDTARTGERTLRIVFPAHVDETGTLHEEAVAWAVVEAPRWAGAMRRTAEQLRDTLGSIKSALKAAEREASRPAPASPSISGSPRMNPGALRPEDSAPSDLAFPLVVAPPSALPSPGGEATAGARVFNDARPAAEGSALPAPQQVRTPRPLSFDLRALPSAAAIDAAHRAAPRKSIDKPADNPTDPATPGPSSDTPAEPR